MSATIITVDEARAMLEAALKKFFELSETKPRKIIGQPKFVQYSSADLYDLTDYDFVHSGIFTATSQINGGFQFELLLYVGVDTYAMRTFDSALSGAYIVPGRIPVVFSKVKNFEEGNFTGFKFQLEPAE